jgi:tetratricopeptide (TPR) repeat protein
LEIPIDIFLFLQRETKSSILTLTRSLCGEKARTEETRAMSQDTREERRDFFISYTGSDRQWAEWIAWQLEEAGYTLFIQAWDFRPGSNAVAEMERAATRAEHTILVLSAAYLLSDVAFSQWAVAFSHDPRGTQRRLLPVRIEPCEVDGFLGSVVPIDLVSLDEVQACEQLLAGILDGRAKPERVAFPGQETSHTLHAAPAFPGSLPAIWNIPSSRNPFFTGREDLLTQLHTHLQTTQTATVSQPQAISGLGGIGKTQLAIEYAYLYRHEYQAVLWASADTTETLNSAYSEIARLLNLPQKDAQEQDVLVKAVKDWLSTHQGWLLILDNADEPTVLIPFLPPHVGGQLLVTTRASDLSTLGRGFGHVFTVKTFGEEESALFLLHRAGLLTADKTFDQAEASIRHHALAISRELGGLPLALDQAGAYLNTTGFRLDEYLHLFQQRHAQLLKERRGMEHPESVATTWDISFKRVERQNPASADLLRLCAFLAPDAIPETIFTAGAQELGPILAPVAADAYLLNQAIESLRAYSLVTRDPHNRTLTVHRLVQAVLRDTLPTRQRKQRSSRFPQHEKITTQQQWMQCAVHAVKAACPEPEFAHWSALEHLLPHALTCATWIEQVPIVTFAAGLLLSRIGQYLNARGQYKEAESLLMRALLISELVQGASHSDTASSLHNLALLYCDQGRYAEAEPLLKRTLDISEQELGPTHPDTALSLNALAELYRVQGKYTEAEPLYQRALAIQEQELGPTHPNTALSLNNLALLYYAQGKYTEAEPLYQRALAIQEQELGASHPDTALSLNNLAALYYAQGKYTEAEPLYQRALATQEQELGASHPDTAQSLNNLALLYYAQGKYTEAEPLYQRALAIQEQELGVTHPDTALSLNNLAELYQAQGKYAEAELLFQRSLAIHEQELGTSHPNTALSLNNLASLYYAQGKYAEAKPLFQRALAIFQQTLGSEHPNTRTIQANYAAFLQMMEQEEE